MSTIAMRSQAPASPQLTGKAPSSSAFVMGSPSTSSKLKQPMPMAQFLSAPPPAVLSASPAEAPSTVEEASGLFAMATNFVSGVAHEIVDDVKYYAHAASDLASTSSTIPTPPPLPTKESTHGHYLIPMAPPLPTREAKNKHYLSRDKTLENASSYLQNAKHFVENVASEIVYDAKYYANAVTVGDLTLEQSGRSIPIPPPLPTRESTHGHYLIPMAPPLPTREAMNKHYLSRDKTFENTMGYIQSAKNFVGEVAAEIVDDAQHIMNSSSSKKSSVPIPPPLPTQESTNGHYLIPLAPPLPTREATHGHYLIPLAPPVPTGEAMNKHYLSRNKTLENAGDFVQRAKNFVEEVATELADDAKYYASASAPLSGSQKSSIPIPPPLPTEEAMNKHFLIPMAPPLPTKEAMNKHYLSRNRTLENAGNYVQRAKNFVEEVATELVDDAKYYASASAAPSFTQKSSSIPIPPPLPTREATHGHYLIPMAPPLPTKESMNKHYLSRDKTLENAGSYIQSAKNLVAEVASEIVYDAKYYASAAAAPLPSFTQESSIPIPPPLPTREATHGHYLIPMAPPLPTKESMNKHYLSRNKTLENAGNYLSNVAHLATEIAEDVKESIMRSVPSTSSSSSIPIPPPLPTKESMHGHYLRNVERKGEAPSLIIANEPVLEKRKGLFSNLFDAASRMLKRGENNNSSIPIPPPLPTKESTNGHFLIPVAPAPPTEEDLNVHYLSRDKTIEKTGSYLHNAAQYVREVVEDVKEYITEAPIDLHRNGIPIPPPLPNEADLNKHYLIPEAPVPPTAEDMNKHYLSRDKTVENATSFLRRVAVIASEVVEDATGYVAIKGHQAVEALPTKEELAYVAEETKQSLIEKKDSATESVVELKDNIMERAIEAGEAINGVKEVIVEKAVELKEAVLPTQKPEVKRTPYARYEVLDESSIWDNSERKTFYNRMILARENQRGSSLLTEGREKEELRTRLRQAVNGELSTDLLSYPGNVAYMPQQMPEQTDLSLEAIDIESSRMAPSSF